MAYLAGLAMETEMGMGTETERRGWAGRLGPKGGRASERAVHRCRFRTYRAALTLNRELCLFFCAQMFSGLDDRYRCRCR
jgi:hypothetical protein